jgi:hypothetical protein
MKDCNGSYTYQAMTGSSSWSTGNTSVATVNNTTSKGLVTGKRVGKTSIYATATCNTWTYSPSFHCQATAVTRTGSGTADVNYGCHDDRDYIIQEYHDYKTSATSPFYPTCGNFTKTAHSQYFSFAELNSGDYAWALVKRPMTVAASSGYGLDAWRVAYGGPRIVNSAYRNPVHNNAVGGVPASRHLFGDAADLRNQSYASPCGATCLAEWDRMVNTALAANRDYVEPSTGPCGYACVHADWRSHDTGIYSQ